MTLKFLSSTPKTPTINQDKPKRYKTAPLPFVGQKRMFISRFEEVLKNTIKHDGEGWTIIDVFGGSGLLAHNAKHILPKATVIYNDFDGYVKRLNAIDDTNRLRQILFELLKDTPRSQKLSDHTKTQVHQVITGFDGFIDVQTLAKWLLFSGRQVGNLKDFLAENTLYNRINLKDYDNAKGYLDNLVITHDSFEILLPKYQDTKNCLLLLDPPYVCTAQGAYNLDGYFGMTQFLTLMHFVRPPYVFFSSTRSELLDYLNYLKTYEPKKWEKVGNFEHITIKTYINKGVSYEDNMLIKF